MRIFIILMVLGAIAYAPVYWAAVPALRRHIGVLFVISFVTLIFGGLFAPPGLFFFLLCPLVMVALTVNRLDAICRFVLLGALVPNPNWPLIVGGTYLIQVSVIDMLGVGLALAMLKPERKGFKVSKAFTLEDAILIMFFFALEIASVRWTEGLNGQLRQILSGSLQLGVPYFVMRRHIRSLTDLRVVISCVAAASVILSVYARYEAVNGWSVFISINEHLGQAGAAYRNLMNRGGTMRASATMSGALMLGCYLSVGWAAILCSRDFVRSRNFWFAGCAIILAGEVATQSRGNLLCVALTVPAVLLAKRRFGLAAATGVAIAAGGGALILAARFSSRVAGFLNLNPDRVAGEDYDYRQLLYRRGMEEAATHRWTGANIKVIVSHLNDIRQGEGIIDFVNTYLFMYLVSGILWVGLTVLTMAIMSYKLTSLSTRRASGNLVLVRAFALAVWTSMIITLSFMSVIDRIGFLFVFTLISCRLARLFAGQESAQTRGFKPPLDQGAAVYV